MIEESQRINDSPSTEQGANMYLSFFDKRMEDGDFMLGCEECTRAEQSKDA